MMKNLLRACACAALGLMVSMTAQADVPEQVVDIPTRSGVTQRMLLLTPPQARAAVVLLAGGHGGLQIQPDGTMRWGGGNFLVRSRQRFAAQGLQVVVLDAPSDHQRYPFLERFRLDTDHVADLKSVVAWLRAQDKRPVWLVGTSRGTQSVAYAATQLAGADAPDGIVLSSTIFDDRQRGPVPDMALEKIRIPVLVVHHRLDGCWLTQFADVPRLTKKLVNVPAKEVLAFDGGTATGDPCEAWSHHGFNGIEDEVVKQTAAWIVSH
jgi:pimeloyl-ACP methyl ester carboxylesterase